MTIEAAKMKEVRMHERTLQNLRHDHDFSLKNERGERRTMYVLILTAITMVVEIVAGTVFGSMALLADGWHMATHVAAFFNNHLCLSLCASACKKYSVFVWYWQSQCIR